MKKLLLLTTLAAMSFGCFAMQNAEEALRQENADLKLQLYQALKANRDLEATHAQDQALLLEQNARLQKLTFSVAQLEKYVSPSPDQQMQQMQAEWIKNFKVQQKSHDAEIKEYKEEIARIRAERDRLKLKAEKNDQLDELRIKTIESNGWKAELLKKERKIKSLEEEKKELERKNQSMFGVFQTQQDQINRLQEENLRLKQSSSSSDARH